MTALIILGTLAALGIGGLSVAIVFLCRTVQRMGNQLIANSDHQIERIRLETGADRIREETGADPVRWNPPQFTDLPDASIPSRSGG